MIYLCDSNHDPKLVLKKINTLLWKSEFVTTAWVYLGRDYLKSLVWEEALGGKFKKISYSKELQALALIYRQPYLDWITDLGKKYDSLAWWTSRIAERNTMLDSLFHKICYYKIGMDLYNRNYNNIFFIVESHSVMMELFDFFKNKKKLTFIFNPLRNRLVRFKRRYFYFISVLRSLRLAFFNTLVLLKEAHHCIPTLPTSFFKNKDKRVVLHTCIDETYFSEDGCPRERYFPKLKEELESRGFEVVIIPWLFNINRSFSQALVWFEQHEGEYIIPERFYSVFDVIWGLKILWKQSRLPKKVPLFMSMKIDLLVRESRSYNNIKFVLYYRLIKKLKKQKILFDVFIDMFENMLTEKAQVISIRKYMPEVLTIGFWHGSSTYPMMLNLFTTKEESKFAPHPDFIVMNSRLNKDQFIAAGFPQEKLRIGPSLRYQYLSYTPLEENKNYVLVLLPFDFSATTELLFKLMHAFPEEEGIHFYLKLHPMMNRAELNSLLEKHPLPGSYMIVVQGEMLDWLAEAICVISTASVAAMEVALLGIPIIRIGRDLDFNLDPLAWFSELGDVVYGHEALRDVVRQILLASPDNLIRWKLWSKKIKKETLSPINDETIDVFVNRDYQNKDCVTV
ncbi:MAG: hypothetical protein A3I12_08240 [Gammaproteobacteria bacterium RIFCSPLOWO2_02_FULL_38_11]|nr:MAG: hypothetical protein A3B69_04555 [Gammaproteobacteria bacterium RIFCSPHIGHO2_02_FULL_38_33]OGT24145.1 MAG: hypothetical protein A2W47_01135 [Gammaproteobacteria bacterium RIFCSPHIGHO2_12_38_15]OGT67369.1 MAG: hypothetical protein A3I12_08240 [Gammaproteobacteria bacterium RIFCSPLOWO2_02_FULL_38_11]